MSIVNPNVNPEEVAMDLTAKKNLFNLLNQDLKTEVRALEEAVIKLENRQRQMYLDGPTDAFKYYEKFVKDKLAFLRALDTYHNSLHKFEKGYLTWTSQVYGEETVKNKIAQAMKGL